MDSETYIQQQRKVFPHRIHRHADVWWFAWSPQYCKPVLPYLPIADESARPAWIHSMLGYSCMVAEGSRHNAEMHVYERSLPDHGEFGIVDVDKSKRSQVRKGLSLCSVEVLDDLEKLLGDLREINISTQSRTGYGRPASWYTERFDEWRREMLRLFELPGRQWWGAFAEGRMVAFLYGYHVDDRMYIDTFKSHGEALHLCPNDALLFRVMEHAYSTLGCVSVINSEWAPGNAGLNSYKEKFGFVKTTHGVRKHITPLARPLVGLAKKLFP